MTEDSTGPALSLPDGWTETRFERGAFGPDDRPGVDAAFERGSAALGVLPVRYECEAREERFEALTADVSLVRHETTATTPDTPSLTAFAVHATYRPVEAEREAFLFVARDADDALAAALRIAAASESDADLQAHVGLHRGDHAAAGGRIVPSDDEALGALFADAADRCAFSGKPTRSHLVELPYRYLPALDGAPETARGVPRLPTTVDSLVAAVSHAEWTERDLDDVAFDAPVERVDAGRYRLDDRVWSLASAMDADRLALVRLGGTSP